MVAGHNLYVYKYDFKKLSDIVHPFKIVSLSESPLKMQIVKDGNICLFYDKKMEVYLVSDQVRKKFSKAYQIP